MADQTVRTIYQAQVTSAQANLNRLAQTTDKAADSADDLADALDKAGRTDVKPEIDVAIEDAEKEVRKLADQLKDLEAKPTSAALDVDIAKSEGKLDTLRRELAILGRMEATPKVEADIAKAEAQIEGLEARITSMQGLKAEMVATADVDQARSDLDQAESRLRALNGAKAEMVVTVDADSVDDAFDGVEDAAAESGEGAGVQAGEALIDGFNSTPIVGAVVGVLGAAGIAGAAALWAGLQVEASEDLFGARTGLDEATARKYGQAAGRSYADAWGDSVSDNLDASMFARANDLIFDTDTVDRISDVNSMLLATTDILGSDIPETAEAAGALIKNGLADNAEEAFDIIITGYQQGADRSGDMLDTLREYSPMFASMGLDGQEALGLISQSMDEGARSSDLAADAIKEFSIRAQDGSDTTRDAFQSMGLDADEMGQRFAAGGDQAREGLDMVLDGLRGIEDPMERNRLGVQLFGTQWEDLGNGAQVLAMDLDTLGDAWVNTGDTAADAMARMSDNAATKLEEARRTIGQALTELGGGLAEAFGDDLGQLADWVSTNRATILEFLQSLGNGFFDLAGAVVDFQATTIEAMGNVAGALSEIVSGIGLAIEAFGHMTGDMDMAAMGQDIQNGADSMQEFADNSDTMADALRENVGGAIDEAQEKFNGFMDPTIAQANVDDAISRITARLDEFTAFVADKEIELTINGDVVPAEEAFNTLLTAVDEGEGSVIINGETYPADEALDAYMREVEESEGVVTLTADPQPAIDKTLALKDALYEAIVGEPVPFDVDTAPAAESVAVFQGETAASSATMQIDADTYYAQAKLDAFDLTVASHGGSVTINGDTANADEALAILETAINNGDGTVTINGTTYPADDALQGLIGEINVSGGTVTISGNNSPAKAAVDAAVAVANSALGVIDVDASTGGAESEINHTARDRDSDIHVDADASAAGAEIGRAARDRYATIYVRTVASVAASAIRAGLGRAYGGKLEGLAYGGTVGDGYGIVPGPRAPYGTDNILWPQLSGRAGGGYLDRPLAGGEFVVNPVSTAAWEPFLQAINGGARPSDLGSLTASVDSGVIGAAVAQAIRDTPIITEISDHVAARLYSRGQDVARANGRRR